MDTRAYTVWGTVSNTGASSIDIVLIDASRPMSIREIEEEIRRRGLPERGAVSSHLNTLKKRGHIVNTPSGWCRTSMASDGQLKTAPATRATFGEPQNPSTPASPPAPSSPASTTSTDRTERVQRIKLMLETGVVVVTLVSGIVALLLRFK
ncbi:hypothetical protein J8F10_22330 [Gemmata sp. G18]|uniref:ArsR family transcriptional regulator n=1 Tax=Gemmata palustris TaxID=2822762 RepID=A0ABS5BX71_9BACT|nr:hypothetical protein [Gemmata palustris]MBP3958002.1 hypothetical protein [Gemmata palustris]